MSRYRRVNIDGRSLYKTETRIASAALLPGTLAVINGSDEFAQATAVVGRLYVIDCAHHEGLQIRDAVPADHSAIGNYLEEGREFAMLAPAGTYAKDDPITLGSNGQIALATDDNDSVIGYVQENDPVVIGAGLTDFIRVRVRAGTPAAGA